jgi:hypothetical protein
MGCSITDPVGCIVGALFGFIIDLINMSLQPFLNTVKYLLSEPVNIQIFSGVWGIIIYLLSMFYGILLICIGIKFILSGESPVEREKAKTSLKNTIIMMVLVQVSYYIYDLIISISSALTKVILNITGNNFFILTYDNGNLGLQILFLGMYLLNLVITALILSLRYICVSVGVVFFAIGIFLYFFDPLQDYGKLIINGLIALIFLPIFYSLIFLACSKLVEVESLQDIKLLITVGAFSLVIIGTVILILFVIIKAAMKVLRPIVKVATTVATAAAVAG